MCFFPLDAKQLTEIIILKIPLNIIYAKSYRRKSKTTKHKHFLYTHDVAMKNKKYIVRYIRNSFLYTILCADGYCKKVFFTNIVSLKA